MTEFNALFQRDLKLFFKDKVRFFTSLITPLALLVLYVTFLGNIYRDSFAMTIPEGVEISKSLINGLVGGQLMSSILATSAVTVAFSSNMLMVGDKASGVINDLKISAARPSALALAYFLTTFCATVIVCFFSAFACLIYIAAIGWYMSLGDILLVLLDVMLIALFGTALSSVICFFMSTQGQISAVSSTVSSGYGFICGAYMPISNFAEGMRNVIMFLPGTYGTSLVRSHSMRGALACVAEGGAPEEYINGVKDAVDCNLYFFGNEVSNGVKYIILILTVIILTGIYVLLNIKRNKTAK